jgi:hypothetical protein
LETRTPDLFHAIDALAPDEADESEELGLPGPPADWPAVQAVAVKSTATTAATVLRVTRR